MTIQHSEGRLAVDSYMRDGVRRWCVWKGIAMIGNYDHSATAFHLVRRMLREAS